MVTNIESKEFFFNRCHTGVWFLYGELSGGVDTNAGAGAFEAELLGVAHVRGDGEGQFKISGGGFFIFLWQ